MTCSRSVLRSLALSVFWLQGAAVQRLRPEVYATIPRPWPLWMSG
jgi:hypothetical protein